MDQGDEIKEGVWILRATQEQIDKETEELEDLKATIRQSLVVSEESLNTLITI
jgi:hypothetical protein